MHLEKEKETENLINSLKREIEENNRKSTYFLKKITDVNYRYLQTLDKLVDSTLENNESLKILTNDISIHSTNEIEKIENYQTSNFKSLELIIDLTSTTVIRLFTPFYFGLLLFTTKRELFLNKAKTP